MKLTVLIGFLSFLSVFNVSAQTDFSVKGQVVDTTSKASLEKATVCVLNAKDSTLQTFTYTTKAGFDIRNLQPGKYLIMITYPDYADFVENFTLDVSKPSYNFNKIGMILKATLLNEVIVKARIVAIKIKGDTTEFNAAAYATQKNAKADDLLKQLPGMKINQSGAIIFQGEQVSKLLVDGEEFFSDDPTLVSKTVRADMISKVQVYDQKSEAAKNTGIDDGIKVKTINLVLSEDKRKGVFGKLDGGYGTDDFYTGQAMFNKFDVKQKISAYGNFGNTGKVGLSGSDNSKYGFGYGRPEYFDSGIPLARDGGVHFDTKWNKDKQNINANYKIGALTIDSRSSSVTQNNLPGNFNTRNSTRSADNYNFNQTLNGSFYSKIDSTADLNITYGGGNRSGTSDGKSAATTVRGNGVLQNTNSTVSIGDGKSESANVNANYIKRLNKKGRSISVNGSASTSNSDNKGYQKSDVVYYDDLGNVQTQESIDQFKPLDYGVSSISGGFNYSDMISKSWSLNAGYTYSRSVNDNSNKSFNRSGSGAYDLLDPLFSSDFRLVNLSSKYNLSFRYVNGDKSNASIGSSVGDDGFKQTDKILAGNIISRKFINWSPSASYYHKLSKSSNISFSYSGYTRQPSLYELQPLRQNSDPLNINIGNPNLKPSFSSTFNYRYYLYEPTLDRGINFRGYFGNTLNAIISNRNTDSLGVNTFMFSNLKGKAITNYQVYGEVYGHATKLDFIVFISMTVRGNTSYNYVNSELQKSKTTTYSPEFEIRKNKTVYSYYLDIAPTFTLNTSSLQKVDNNSKGFNVDLGYYTKLPRNFFMGSDLNYKFVGKNKVFDKNFEQALFKTYFGRTFLKEEGLKLAITANDLFNQNTGYSRYGNDGSFTEYRNNTIGRYFMFSASWDFSKFGKSLQKQQP
ncbi:outer membrane beta-barrel protein [Pedobacter sp. PWIIR3]